MQETQNPQSDKKKLKTVKVKHGRPVVVDPEIKAWRMRMARFKRLKGHITVLLNAQGWDKEQLRAWLNTPVPELRNRTPKQLLNPNAIAVLMKWARRVLKS